MRLVIVMLCCFFLVCCKTIRGGTKVVKPKTHKMWAKGNKYLIDIPVGARHIHLFERKRTKVARMN